MLSPGANSISAPVCIPSYPIAFPISNCISLSHVDAISVGQGNAVVGTDFLSPAGPSAVCGLGMPYFLRLPIEAVPFSSFHFIIIKLF